jgi:hypothetical protein
MPDPKGYVRIVSVIKVTEEKEVVSMDRDQ